MCCKYSDFYCNSIATARIICQMSWLRASPDVHKRA